MDALIQRRKVVKQKATRLQTFLENNSATSASIIDIQIRIDKLEECLNQFNEMQEQIETLCTEEGQFEAQEAERDNFETKYFRIKSGLLSLLQELSTVTPASVLITPSVTSTAKVKLPLLELPIFSGNYQEWFSFYDLFVALIHNNNTLSPAQKLHYLKTTLRGEAARLLQSIQVTDANYNEAWSILTNRYQNKRQIVHSHIKSLFNQPTLHTESATGLRKLLDTTVEHIRALNVLSEPTEHWGSILVHMVVERMDADSRRQWELSTPTTELPSFEDLKRFLEQRCRALEAAGTNKTKPIHFASRPSTGTASTKLATSSYHSTTKLICTICKAEHFVYQCPKFNQAVVAERTKMAREHSLCFNCLRSGHSSKQCKSSSCRKCHNKHHTLLHFERADAETNGLNVSPNNGTIISRVVNHVTSDEYLRTEILLLTALVKVMDSTGQQQICRALVDSGSQSSFITEPCVQRLGLHRYKASTPIQGIGNSQVENSRGMVNLKVKSTKSNFTIALNALVLPKITGQLPATNICTNNYKHLTTLDLADPSFNIPGDVDLLFGAEIFADLLLEGKVLGKHGAPSAQKTVFGWILSGRVNAPFSRYTSSHQIISNHVVNLDCEMKSFWELEEVPRIQSMSVDEKQCEEHFKNNHSRDQSGRYVVRLPFRDDQLILGNSREMAIKRFQQLEKKLSHSPSRKQQYHKFMQEYLDLGHMELISQKEILKPAN